MYNKILVPHAGTPAGDLALKHAMTIAKTSAKCKVILLHVVEKMPYPPSIMSISSSDMGKLRMEIDGVGKEIKAGMDDEFTKKIKEYRSKTKRGITITGNVVIGYPFDEIMKEIKKEKPDLVVMAKRRKLSGFKSILALGSVSRKLVERAPCPVLLVDTPS